MSLVYSIDFVGPIDFEEGGRSTVPSGQGGPQLLRIPSWERGFEPFRVGGINERREFSAKCVPIPSFNDSRRNLR